MEDVMGGKDAWANVDKTDGMFRQRRGQLVWWEELMWDGYLAQCPREGCDGSQAFFYQVQIRSADEPMTIFLKVLFPLAPGIWSFMTSGD